MEFHYWKSSNGVMPVKDFIEALPDETRSRLFDKFEMYAQYPIGNFLSSEKLKRLEGTDELYEVRIRLDKHYSFLCKINGPIYSLVHAFVKTSQKTPLREIRTAEARLLLKNN